MKWVDRLSPDGSGPGHTGLWAAEFNLEQKDLKQRKKDLGKVNKQLTLTKEGRKSVRRIVRMKVSPPLKRSLSEGEGVVQMEPAGPDEVEPWTVRSHADQDREDRDELLKNECTNGEDTASTILTSETYLDLAYGSIPPVILGPMLRSSPMSIKGPQRRYQDELIRDHKSEAAITAVGKDK
jgi:hypothetical protein